MKMPAYLALGASLLVALVAVVFALQNADQVTVRFLSWEFQGSVAMMMLTTFACGALSATLAVLTTLGKGALHNRTLAKRIKDLEARLVDGSAPVDGAG